MDRGAWWATEQDKKFSCKESDMIEQLSVQAVTIVVGGAITDDDVAKTVSSSSEGCNELARSIFTQP